MNAQEHLAVCDESDRIMGRASRAVVHAQGLRHRAVHIVVLNRRGRVFVQRRGPHKDTYPGLWDTAVGGHLDLGETVDEAARRELAEELALVGEPEVIGRHEASEATGWEFITVFELVTDTEPRWDGAEVVDGRWMTPEEIDEALRAHPREFTPSFQMTHRLWSERRRHTAAA